MALGLLWRTIHYALGMPIWGDEAFVAVDFVVRDYREMIEPSVYGQIVPLLFMWAELAISRVLGLSERALHLLPYVAGVVALLLFCRFAGHVLPRRAALLAIAIFAASFYVVRHSAEVKPYETDLLVALGMTMLAWSVFEQPRLAARWIALLVLAAVSPWCSYPVAFIGGSVGVLLTWLLVRERGRAGVLAGWLAFGLVFAASYGWMYWVYGRPHAQFASHLTEITMWRKTFPPLAQPWKLPLWFVYIHTDLMFAYPHGGKAPGSVGTFLLFLVGAVRLWRRRPALVVLLLTPWPLTFVAAALHAYPYGGSARTSLYMAPAICLLTGLGAWVALHFLTRRVVRVMRARGGIWTRPWPFHLRNGVYAATAALALFVVGAVIADVIQPYKSLSIYKSREAVRAVARQTAPGDRWVIFNADRQVPYAPYMGDWHGVGGQFVFDALRFAPPQIDWAPPPESVSAPPGGRVWLLAYRAVHPKVDFSDEQLEAYVQALSARLGPPQRTEHGVKSEASKQESLIVYRFDHP